jgi:hypothetical protein
LKNKRCGGMKMTGIKIDFFLFENVLRNEREGKIRIENKKFSF